ncbi:hypothetical protein EV385_1837 [Krasilnikovia cinnamomea]|uniref:Uncharacterized protein n=1 Tax=Krasilnikovia cinnamomea TaxID=349313 RepID=A0A4Q7ZIN3_9ACTN|nr:hypothetical protein [Krasilnikovia cinnamomea]RZU50075.1 hypothetical protein EV385_1837 [Krasilnikovia cinnamomea]
MSGNAPTGIVGDGRAEMVGDGPDPSPVVVTLPVSRPLRIRRYASDEGPGYWRWDCADCGEYGGGRHHTDAVTRAMRHCGEHPHHRSSLLPPIRCRQAEPARTVHPMLFAVDDDPPPPPLDI